MRSRILPKLQIIILGLVFVLNCTVAGSYAQLSPTQLGEIPKNRVSDLVGVGVSHTLTPTMFHYQMFPHPVPPPSGKRKRCIMTENGMKCKHRRDGQDSYLMAAGSVSGAGHSSSYGVPLETSHGWGWPAEEEEHGGGGGADFLGLLGLLGLKGLKGLKGFKGLVTLLPLLPFLFPILLPIIAFPFTIIGTKLLLTAIAVLFIPVGVGKRSYSELELDHNFLRSVTLSNVPSFVRDVLNSEECLERIVCQVAKNYEGLEWMEKLTGSKLWKGVNRKINKKEIEVSQENGIDTELDSHAKDCKRFICNPEFIKGNTTEVSPAP